MISESTSPYLQFEYPPKTVELRKAKIPPAIAGYFVDHYWFVIEFDNSKKERWEVWHKTNAGPTCWGHVHLNLKPHDAGVGNGPSSMETQWKGKIAKDIADILRNPNSYPWYSRYFYWPGPNSNTYVNWILMKSGVKYRLGSRAWGRKFALLSIAK